MPIRVAFAVTALGLAAGLGSVPSAANAQHHHSPNAGPVQAGTFEQLVRPHPTSTRDAAAQALFDQGLFFIYAFNHDAALRAFAEAAQRDPRFAMAHWGTALALSSNINSPLTPERAARAKAAIERAAALAGQASARERAYITAMQRRYADAGTAGLEARERRYADAMRELSERYPEDPDAATLYADALMNLSPWEYWTKDGAPGAATPIILAALERAMRLAPDHVGANHYYIHAIEASPRPERGLASAHRLDALRPPAGHLAHMPSHIYWRVGDYEAMIRANTQAVAEDELYFAKSRRRDPVYLGYYAHSLDFLVLGHSYRGDMAGALGAADRFSDAVRPILARSPGAEHYLTRRPSVLLRFGRWNELLALPMPPKSQTISHAFWHYARGVALAQLGRVEEATAAGQAFEAARRAVPSDATIGRSPAGEILAIAADVLNGRLAARRGDIAAAARYLRSASARQDQLAYDEPPNWYYPVRETLGAVLLQSGDASAAQIVFREDLARHPGNPRSLHGLAESLRRLGRDDEAAVVAQEAQAAWKGEPSDLLLSTF